MIKSLVAMNGNTSPSATLSMVKAYLSFLFYYSRINRINQNPSVINIPLYLFPLPKMSILE